MHKACSVKFSINSVTFAINSVKLQCVLELLGKSLNAIRSNYFLFLSSSYCVQFEVYLQTLSKFNYLFWWRERGLNNIKHREGLVKGVVGWFSVPSVRLYLLWGLQPNLYVFITTSQHQAPRTQQSSCNTMDDTKHGPLGWLHLGSASFIHSRYPLSHSFIN